MNIYSCSFPILNSKNTSDNYLITGGVLGTCFSIGNGYFLTAGHVIEGIGENGTIGVVGLFEETENTFKGIPIIKKEILSCDVGIIQVVNSTNVDKKTILLPWQKDELHMFDEVRCAGYPFGLDNVEEKYSLINRGFQGNVVSSGKNFKPLTYSGYPFTIYELSFQVPRGLSGSPLITSKGDICVLGIIIGNSKERILVFEQEEMEESDSLKVIVQQYESLSLGIAVRSMEILKIVPSILGISIEEYLSKNNLLK